MKLRLLTLAFLSTIFFQINAQTVLYSEDFSSQIGKGVKGPAPYFYDTSGVTWKIDPGTSSLTASTDYFKVNVSEQFEGSDVDGDIYWLSSEIDISSVIAANIKIDVWETGNIASTEYIRIYYILDYGPETIFEINGDNTGDFSNVIAQQDSLFGTTLQIKIKLRNSAGTKSHFFDNIVVRENISNVQGLYDLLDTNSIHLNWLNPASAFDEVLIVANENIGLSSGQPFGDGSTYTSNSSLGLGTTLLGGSVIYKGIGTTVNFTGVTSNNTYYFKVFTRKDTTWSTEMALQVFFNPPNPGDILITEYVRHSSISEYGYLELFNTTNMDINLSGTKIIANNLVSISKVIDVRTEIPNSIVVPANGFLLLNRDRAQTNFESTWGVDLSTTGYPVTYNRTGEANFGNLKFFVLKLGGTENTNDGIIINESTKRPTVGERVYQLPIGYWNKMGSVADSATPGYFENFEDPTQIDLIFADGTWVPSAPSSSTGTKNAAIISGDAIFTNGSILNSLYIWNNTGTNITSENVTINSNLTVESSGSISITGTGSLNCNGTTTVKRKGFSANSDYNIWGTPLSTLVDIQTTFPNTNPCDMYLFEASSQTYKHDFTVGSTIICLGNSNIISSGNVINAPEGLADDNFDVGRGYFIPGNPEITREFSGSPAGLNNGNIAVNIYGSSGISVSGSNDWNLISNPYPSAVSANDFISTNLGMVTNAIYVYDQGLSYSSFSTYNSTDGHNIASCQGFFVDANSNTDGLLGTVDFTNSMRNTQNDDFRSTNKLHSIYLSASNMVGSKDVTRIYFDSNAEEEFDYTYDAAKMMNETFNLASIVNGKHLIFNGLPELTNNTRIIPLYFNSSISANYTFEIDSLIGPFTEKDIILEDRFLRKFQDLCKEPYSFHSDSSDWNNRFFLHVQNTSTPTGITQLNEEYVNITSLEKEVLVTTIEDNRNISSVQLLDVKGQLVANISGNSNSVSIPTFGFSSGIYFVKFVLNTGQVGVKKVVIR